MASHTPFAGLTPEQLRQHLAVTDIDPAEMFGLGLVYFADPDAVDVMCEHAKMSFRLLIGLYAAQRHVKNRRRTASHLDRHWFFCDRVQSCMASACGDALDVDLLEGLHTARTMFDGGSTFAFRNTPMFVSHLFAEHAREGALCDRVIAEMSVSDTDLLSPELGFETRCSAPRRGTTTTPLIYQYVSRFLLTRFGFHGPSWEMFKHVHTSDARIGDVVGLVLEVETSDS